MGYFYAGVKGMGFGAVKLCSVERTTVQLLYSVNSNSSLAEELGRS
jgi:hypothetical protein